MDRAEQQLRMVVAPMGSHGRGGLARSEPGGSSSGWVSSRAAMRAAGLACRQKADWRFERLQLLLACPLPASHLPRAVPLPQPFWAAHALDGRKGLL